MQGITPQAYVYAKPIYFHHYNLCLTIGNIDTWISFGNIEYILHRPNIILERNAFPGTASSHPLNWPCFAARFYRHVTLWARDRGTLFFQRQPWLRWKFRWLDGNRQDLFG